MFSNIYREVIVPAGLIAALIIGAGMFSLPYLFSVAGIWLGVVYLFLFAGAFSIIHLMYLRIIRQTKEEHRFVGYAREYLGRYGFWASMVTTLVALIFVLLIYLVLGAYFTQAVFPNLTQTASILIFWFFSAGAVVLGIKKVANAELLVAGFMGLIIFIVFFFGFSSFSLPTFSLDSINPAHIFIPYGAVLLAFAGRPAISSIHEYMKDKQISERRTKMAIVLGTVIPAILYLLFVIGVLGITGNLVSEDAVSSIRSVSPGLGILLALLSLFSIWTSYLFLGLEAKKILSNDLKFPIFLAAGIVSLLPLLMYLGGLNNLIELIAIAGGVLWALESAMVVVIYLKMVKPKLTSLIFSLGLISIFVFGAIYTIFTSV